MIKPANAPYFFLFGSVFQFLMSYGLAFIAISMRINLSLEAMLFASQVIGFGVPLLLFMKANHIRLGDIIPHAELGIGNALIVLIIVLLSLPITYFLSGVTVVFFNNNVTDLHNNSSLFKTDTLSVVMTLFLTVALPAVFEELSYRGLVLTALKKMSLLKSSVLCGFFFALMHLDPQQFLYTFYLGAVLAIFVRVTKSIYAGILGHMMFNGLSALISYASSSAEAADLPDLSLMSIGGRFDYLWSTLLIFLVLSLMALAVIVPIIRFFIRRNEKIAQDDTRNFQGSENTMFEFRKAYKSFRWATIASVAFYVSYIIAFQIIRIQDKVFF